MRDLGTAAMQSALEHRAAECARVITGGCGETSEALGTNRALLMLQCVHVMRAVVGMGKMKADKPCFSK